MANSDALSERFGAGNVARDDYALRKVSPTWRYRTSEIVLSLLDE